MLEKSPILLFLPKGPQGQINGLDPGLKRMNGQMKKKEKLFSGTVVRIKEEKLDPLLTLFEGKKAAGEVHFCIRVTHTKVVSLLCTFKNKSLQKLYEAWRIFSHTQ